MSILRKILLTVAVALALTPSLAAAQDKPLIDCGPDNVLIGCNTSSGAVQEPDSANFGALISNVTNGIISIFALVAVVFVVKGGINLISSLGNDEKMKKAKNTIIYALLGLFISTLAYMIVSIVTSIRLF